MIIRDLFRQIMGERKSFGVWPAYRDFEEAVKNTKGYENRDIVQVVSRKTENLRRTLSEGDPLRVIEDRQTVQNVFVLSHVWTGEPLSVLEVGGACGAAYFVLDHLLPGKIGSWDVLETPTMVAEARRIFQGLRLKFIDDIEQVASGDPPFHLLFASGVFQYLPRPMAALDAWLKMRIPFVYLTRTLVGIELSQPVVTKQVTDLALHGPGPFPEGFLNHKTSQPMTIIPYETIVSSLAKVYTKEFVFKEDEGRSVRIGSQKMKIGTIGLFLKDKKRA